MKYKRMPLAVSVHLRYLHQDLGLKGKDLVKRYPEYPCRTIYYHMKLPICQERVDRRHNNPGRPRKLSLRDERKLVAQINKLRRTAGVFNSKHIQEAAGISEKSVSNRTVRRRLNKLTYKYLQCRRKGQVTPKDMKKRLHFARKVKRMLPANFWTEGLSFYLDGVSWVHKTNPCRHARTCRTRTWRKPSEGLSVFCTAKGKKEGVGGKVARFTVAIGHGVGVVHCEQHFKRMNGQLFADFIKQKFPEMFTKSANPRGRLFLQDGDPSQNSAKARQAMDDLNYRVFKIPPRSPDINPIENTFHLISKQLRRDALEKQITKETFKEFSLRCKQTVESFSTSIINKTIESMGERIDLIIKGKGKRTKY